MRQVAIRMQAHEGICIGLPSAYVYKNIMKFTFRLGSLPLRMCIFESLKITWDPHTSDLKHLRWEIHIQPTPSWSEVVEWWRWNLESWWLQQYMRSEKRLTSDSAFQELPCELPHRCVGMMGKGLNRRIFRCYFWQQNHPGKMDAELSYRLEVVKSYQWGLIVDRWGPGPLEDGSVDRQLQGGYPVH